jgi:uncharacterized membrane protein
MRTVGFSLGLFAIAVASLGVFTLVYGDFAPGDAALPAWLPARQLFTDAFGVLLLAASAGLFLPRAAAASAMIIIAYLAIWALLGVPGIISAPLTFGGWYGFVEALSVLVGAWLLYAIITGPRGIGSSSSDRAIRVAQILFGLTCIFYGGSHFAYAEYTAAMVPTWLPAHLGFAYLTGLFHILAGICIVFAVIPNLAATLEAIMMSLFGLLVWVPTFLTQPRPKWAVSLHNQWSELVVNLVLAAAAWIVAASFKNRDTTVRTRI